MRTKSEAYRAARFVRLWAIAALAAATLATTANAIVDPHGLVRWVDAVGFNSIKPRATQTAAAFKFRAIDVIRPKSLILGNSRAEMGWDPELLDEAGLGPSVNAALPAANLRYMADLAEYAWHVSEPHTLLVGAEFFDCLVKGEAAQHEVALTPSPWAQLPEGAHGRAHRAVVMLTDLTSLDTLLDSAGTILAQRNPAAPDLRADGFQPAREYPSYLRVDGARKMFLQRDRENIARRSAEPKSIRFADGTPAPCFRHLQTILAKAAARKQEVFVATYPYHARLLEIIVALDLWPAYEDWKIELVRTVDSARQQGARVTLRDFGGFHSYAQDKLPLDGSRAPAPEWYWESGHFKSALGNRMLAAIFQNGVPQGSFGVELTGANVAKHLGLVRDEKQEFESRDSAVAAEIRQLVAVRAGRPSVASRAGPSPRDMPPAAPVLPGSPE